MVTACFSGGDSDTEVKHETGWFFTQAVSQTKVVFQASWHCKSVLNLSMVRQGRPRGISFHLQQDREPRTTSASHQEDTKEMLHSLGFIPHPGAMAHSHQQMMGPGKPGHVRWEEGN